MKDRGEKKFFVIPFFWSYTVNVTKLNDFIFEMLKKKIWANFQRIIDFFAKKFVSKLSKIWVWDPGSGKNLFRIPDPGVKKAPDPGSGSATLVYSLIISHMTTTDQDRLFCSFTAGRLMRSVCRRPSSRWWGRRRGQGWRGRGQPSAWTVSTHSASHTCKSLLFFLWNAF
jgi:hypothetical protein